MSRPTIAILVLAAGASRRMQEAKQLIQIDGKTLLENAIEQALASQLGSVYVVYGAHQELVLPLIERCPVKAVENPGWEEGLGSSIRAGVAAVESSVDQLLIMLADQPLVNAALLQQLATQQSISTDSISACTYGDTIGVPAIFPVSTFSFLQKIQGDKGAKSLMLAFQKQNKLRLLEAPSAAIDLDTQEDVSKFKKNRKN